MYDFFDTMIFMFFLIRFKQHLHSCIQWSKQEKFVLLAKTDRTLTELGGLGGFLDSKMPLDWIKIGLNSAEKITLLFLRIPLQS